MSKICKRCNKEYNSQNKKFCSKQCADLSLRVGEIKNCKVCNKEFYPIPSNVRKGYGVYCSKECNSKDPEPFYKEKKEYYIKLCEHCNKEFYIWGYRKDNAKFCSKQCYDDNRRDVIVCNNCHNIFSSPKYEKRKFCSQNCATLFFSSMATSLWETDIYNIIKQNGLNSCQNNVPIFTKNNMFNADIVYNKKIIECNGDYWHCNPDIYDEQYYHTKLKMTAKEKWEYDKMRIDIFKSLGYDVLIVWERDFYKNKEKELKKCLTFLRQK